MVGRALEADADMRLGPHRVEQGARDPRLADAGLADQQHSLPLAGSGLAPAFQQQRQLLVTADHRQESSTTPGLEAAAGSTFAQHREGCYRQRQAFQRLRRERRQLERGADQLPRGLGDHHLARLGHALQPGRQVGRLADHGLLLRRSLADQLADHDEPGGDADPAGQGSVTAIQLRRPRRPWRARHEPPAPPRPRAPLANRNRPSTPSPMNFATWPSKPQDLAGDGVLVGAQHRAHLLRVEALGKRSRADEIDEHHRELTPLGLAGRRAGLGRRCQWWRTAG